MKFAISSIVALAAAGFLIPPVNAEPDPWNPAEFIKGLGGHTGESAAEAGEAARAGEVAQAGAVAGRVGELAGKAGEHDLAGLHRVYDMKHVEDDLKKYKEANPLKAEDDVIAKIRPEVDRRPEYQRLLEEVNSDNKALDAAFKQGFKEIAEDPDKAAFAAHIEKEWETVVDSALLSGQGSGMIPQDIIKEEAMKFGRRLGFDAPRMEFLSVQVDRIINTFMPRRAAVGAGHVLVKRNPAAAAGCALIVGGVLVLIFIMFPLLIFSAHHS